MCAILSEEFNNLATPRSPILRRGKGEGVVVVEVEVDEGVDDVVVDEDERNRLRLFTSLCNIFAACRSYSPNSN